MPRVLRVCSRTRSLKRAIALGAIRLLGSRSPVKLNPRNFLCPGRATALFAWFTLSLSRCVMKCVMLSITRVDIDVAVAGITHKVVTAPLQLSVQFVQHRITEQRRKYSSNAKDNFCFERILRYR